MEALQPIQEQAVIVGDLIELERHYVPIPLEARASGSKVRKVKGKIKYVGGKKKASTVKKARKKAAKKRRR